ncbi:MAG: cytidine/deoxycytidylate deaminase family protein [Patescibacteria group bacterium]|nr:cytidine/deoxycytidylate deaminase family protein [Patescibacteria group bacterium]
MEEQKNDEKYFRPKWDDYFMAIARIIATRSTCDRLRAGAVLVKNNRIISTGYNGAPPGLPHCDGPDGHLIEEGHCIRTIHGEHNALLQAALVPGASTEGTTLYTTYSPCMHCCKYIVACHVSRVVLGKIYRAEQAIQYLKDAGLQVDIYEEKKEVNNFLASLYQKEIETMDPKEGGVQLRTE